MKDTKLGPKNKIPEVFITKKSKKPLIWENHEVFFNGNFTK